MSVCFINSSHLLRLYSIQDGWTKYEHEALADYDKGKQKYLEKNSWLHFIHWLAWDWTQVSTMREL